MEEIREKATAAKEKINKYFERKRNQGKMGPNTDAKSRKRIGVMKDSMDSIMALAGQIDDKLAVMEQKELEAGRAGGSACKRAFEIGPCPGSRGAE